jgi:hypothetical protein
MAHGTVVNSIPIDVTGPQPFEKVQPNGVKASDVQALSTTSKSKSPLIH